MVPYEHAYEPGDGAPVVDDPRESCNLSLEFLAQFYPIG